ncbi:hypothetical protein [Mucilaginibacter gracilis]|nr:hypothetical protein [Mucilaginibacter gracilis]
MVKAISPFSCHGEFCCILNSNSSFYKNMPHQELERLQAVHLFKTGIQFTALSQKDATMFHQLTNWEVSERVS